LVYKPINNVRGIIVNQYKDKVNDRLRGKIHLIPVFTNVYRIPERLRTIDSNLFVVFNIKTKRYEIHSLANMGDTLSLNVPFRELDARCEDFVKKYDLKRHGRKIYQELDKQNEELEKSMERKRKNDMLGRAEEVAPAFRKAAWGV